MGTTISGAGCAQSQSAMKGSLAIQNKNAMVGSMLGVGKTQSKAKKPLNYNHREISGQLMRVKKSQSAGTVLTRAKSRLANLQRAAGSGQYDSKEVANAIAHARRMVRCAQLKVRNLKEEEREQASHTRENAGQEQKKRNEVKRRVSQKERDLKSKVVREEVQQVTKEKRKRNEMVQKRRMHRNQEQGKINEANMKYIKAQMEDGKGTGGCSTSGAGAVLDLSMEAAAMAEVQMLEQMMAEQIETEVEAEVEAEMEVEIALESGGASFSGASQGMSSGGDGAATAEAGSVDVSI